MQKNLKVFIYNLIFFLIFILIFEIVFGYWFKKNNFGIHMRNERNKNWKTTSVFNDKEYSFFYKRNFYGFRGDEFNPEDVKIIFNGGSTSNQRYTPEKLTIVGQLNSKLDKDKINLKIYNAATNGKSLRGIIYDFKFWFSKIEKLNPKVLILYLGINERTLAEDLGQKNYDLRVKNNKIDQFKDFVKNNSFVYEKFIKIKNSYFPKNTSGYFFDTENLYNEYAYISYNKAKNKNYQISEGDKEILMQVRKRFNKLKTIFNQNQITPIFITQVEYDGLKDNKLYFVNELIKELAKENNYHIIKLDELIVMETDDFYDKVHTTPQGSERIVKVIYPYLKKILEKLDR